MMLLIIKILIIFLIVNLLEQGFLFLFKVKPSVMASLILNNILGIVFLYLINYYKLFVMDLNLINIAIVSGTGIIGLILLLMNLVTYF